MSAGGPNKRKKGGGSSSDDSFTEMQRDGKIRREESVSEGGETGKMTELRESNSAIFEALTAFKSEICEAIDKRLDHLATKDDVRTIRVEMEKACESLSRKVDVMEGRVYDTEKKQDGLANKIEALQNENDRIKHELDETSYAIEELSQYGRRNNIKIYGLKEEWKAGGSGETAEETVKKVVKLCTEDLGCDIRERDIAIAHRLNKKREGKERSIIVRFVRRMDRNTVIRHRRALKGKPIVIVDDLSPFFTKLFFDFKDILGQNNVWSVEGHIFVKIRGRVSKVGRDNREQLLREAREAQTDRAYSDSDSHAPSSTRDSPTLRGYGRGSPTTRSTDSMACDSGERGHETRSPGGRGRGKHWGQRGKHP